MSTYAILGGYGLLGRRLAQALLERTDGRVRIVGRRIEPAQALVAELAARFGPDRVEARRADVARAGEVAEAARGADWLLLSVDGARHLEAMIEGALAARAHVMDLLITPGRDAVWRRNAGRFEAEGLVAITEGGVQPGLPGALLRLALAARPDARDVQVATVVRVRVPRGVPMPGSMVDLVSGFLQKPTSFARGRARIDWLAFLFPYRFVRFAPPFGWQTVSPVGLPEVAAVAARHPEVGRVRSLVGGFNAVATWIVLPLVVPLLLLGRWIDRPVAALLFHWVLPWTRPPHGVALRAEVRAPREAAWAVEVQHDDEYGVTVDAVTACLRQVEARPRVPGTVPMALAVDPEALLVELAARGARVLRSA